MNKISIENAEQLSPQELVELIITNVPFNNIRSCLTNLESTIPPPPVEVEEPVKPVIPIKSVKEPKSSNDVKSLTSLRNMCKDDPILIVETDRKVKNKDELQVIYYAKSKKDNKYKKFSMDVSKFNKDTCNKLAEEDDSVCRATSEWIDEQLDSGKDIAEIRKVINDYLSSGINLYISKCSNFREIKEKLGIEQPTKVQEQESEQESVDESVLSAMDLSRLYTPNSDYLIYTKDRKENNIRVAYYDQNKKSWATEDKDKSFIKTIKTSSPFARGTPEYRIREEALGSIEIGSSKYKNLSLLVKDIVNSGIKLPYEFLNNLPN